MNYIYMVWEVQYPLHYRPFIDKGRKSAVVTMQKATTLSEFVNALCDKGRHEMRKSRLQIVSSMRKASGGQAKVELARQCATAR
jgi:hypothetical protein